RMHRTFQCSHLLPFYISRSVDRMNVIGNVTEAVFPVDETFNINIFKSDEQTLSERADAYGIGIFCNFKQVGQVKYHKVPVKARDTGECRNGHFDVSELHCLDRFSVRWE